MKNIQFKKVIKIFLLVGIAFAIPSVVQAATSFTFDIPQGQGVLNNEFYRGRCVRANVVLDTDGHNTGGADLIIDYDNTLVEIVQSNCSTAATSIYTGSQYNNYTNNIVSTTQIKLGSYNNPGNSYNGTGTFAYFYYTVLSDSGNYDWDYDFTPGITTDCNLAEYGTGNDILEQADNYTVSLLADSDTPTVSDRDPDDGATNVPANDNIEFRLNDGDAGVDISTLDVTVSGANWGTVNYTEVSGGVSYNCHTTNANRVDYCDVVINPANNFYYTEVMTVDITISDLGVPTVHTLSNHTYTFTVEDDNDAPAVYNRNPNNGQNGVSTMTNVNFNVRDIAVPGGYPGTGVDISTLSVTISAAGWGTEVYTNADPEMIVTVLGNNDYGNVFDYGISINPDTDFPENTLVNVSITVDDYGLPTINTLNTSYSFTTADTVAPECSLYTPERNAVSMAVSDDITFHCTDEGTGVDIDSLSIIVNGITYTRSGVPPFTYSGDSSDYFITINPDDDFDLYYALEVIINVRDIANNAMDQVSYGLAIGTTESEECPTCETCPTCEECEECEECPEISELPQEEIQRIGELICTSASIVLPSSSGLESVTLSEINGQSVGVGDISVRIRIEGDEIIFSGEADPNMLVAIMVKSDPLILMTTSDEEGKWQIRAANILPEGIHDVYAVSMKGGKEVVDEKWVGEFEIIRKQLILWWFWIIVVILIIINLWQYRKWSKLKNKKRK
ncbi:hypothetical protein K8R20_03275 [bacterium]|nr:hypothetical protein [bacterium]